ncbi:MAG: hypothetical protein HW383_543 [Candidatus Magasanikbacteria bacterium]|nr:hypothetical protein [Candidatus Magasanikbacteria bacterium]
MSVSTSFEDAMKNHCVGKPVRVKCSSVRADGREYRSLANRKMSSSEAARVIAIGIEIRSWRQEEHNPAPGDHTPNVPTGDWWKIYLHEDDIVGIQCRRAESRPPKRSLCEAWHDMRKLTTELILRAVLIFVILPAAFVVAMPLIVAIPLAIGGGIMFGGWVSGLDTSPVAFFLYMGAGYVVYSCIVGWAFTYIAFLWDENSYKL